MNRTQRSRRLTGSILALGLMALGLPLTTAHAAGGPNLASGKSTAASTSNGTFVAGNIADGNQATYWESNGPLPQWVQVDLGSAVSVDQVVLKVPAAWSTRTETLSIDGSTTGTSFSTISASTGRTFTSGTNAVTIGFAAVTTRFVRVTISANTGWTQAQLSELEVYGAATSSTNLALGKATTGANTQTYVSGNSVDGNQATYWEGVANAYPNLLRVDLGTATPINKVVLKVPAAWGARTETLAVQGSTDGTTFTDIVASAAYNFSSAAGNAVTINFAATTVRYVRLSATANTGSTGAQISEFEVYAAGCAGDCIAPSAPTNLSGTTSGTTVNLTWTAATDATGVTGYDVFANGVLRGTVGAVTAYADTNQPATA
ncbi:MAG: hypothetical protein QOC60_163, partial [Frankiaceae bacterium]|nr:hypothetical protein [Frankiaceae bacterium]